MRRGQSLEKLIECLERAMADKENVTIESPKKLRDILNGSLREHDVVVTITQGHHKVLISIECRDHSRPITVNQVEGFWAKCQHTGIDQGILVSPKGFYRTARKKAETLGLRCLDLEQVESFNWLLAKGITTFSQQIRHINWTIVPECDLEEAIEDYKLIDPLGNEFTIEILQANIIRTMQEKAPDLQDLSKGSGARSIIFEFKGDGIFLYNNKNSVSMPIKKVIAQVEYDLNTEFSPFVLYKYADKGQQFNIVDAAVSQVELGESKKGQIIIAYKDGEGGKVMFLSDSFRLGGINEVIVNEPGEQ